MNWTQAYTTMDSKVIKTDVIASEDAYFMATHVPFNNLEIVRGGQINSSGRAISEEQVYTELIYNPNNDHRFIIVRGNNGTGKSHLIRWLCARFKNDKERYNPESEKIIFLRRLSNTIRGAVKQILDEDIVFDEEMRNKLEKFVSSTQSMDADKFKLNIYHQFIVAVGGDTNDKPYGKGVRREISAFLTDARVEQHMLRPGGPVDRCYNAITAPSSEVFKGEASFSAEDFKLPRTIKKEIKNSGSSEAKTFMDELDEEKSIEKFVKYLNNFTPKVIQGCAEISSESTKDIFVQLRRALKKQGKNLTIFIEDFTAFTGLDSELITVLASEHGGENADLCRVTSVIGITDAYYAQFRDNFTDRVQYQINVTEDSYGYQDFLVEMTARYLNAIYSKQQDIEKWFSQGAKSEQLPTSGYFPPYDWEKYKLGEQEVTLYPFNRKSIVGLYEALYDAANTTKSHAKTPRMFLLHVIKEQLSMFFEGQEGAKWRFPSDNCIARVVSLNNAAHASEIDGMASIEKADKTRLKVLLSFWGDGTASASNGNVGGITKLFLNDISIGAFEGFGGVQKNPQDASHTGNTTAQVEPNNVGVVVTAQDKNERELDRRLNDINKWFNDGETLNYSADIRKWIKEFVSESINWAAEGVPAHIANKRFIASTAVYVEGQKETTDPQKALIKLSRTIEDKNLMIALVYHNYADGWGFENGVYFQLKAITWLEAHRSRIMSDVVLSDDYRRPVQYLKWCAEIEYIRAILLGRAINSTSEVEVAKEIFRRKEIGTNIDRANGNQAWNDLIQNLKSKNAEYYECNELLCEGLRTYMGTGLSSSKQTVGFFRGEELFSAIDELSSEDWVVPELPTKIPNVGVMHSAQHLKDISKHLGKVAESEDEIAIDAIKRIDAHVGKIDQDTIAKLVTSIKLLFIELSNEHIIFKSEIKAPFDAEAKDIAKELVGLCCLVKNAIDENNVIRKLALYSSNPLEKLKKYINAFNAVEKLAKDNTAKAKNEIKQLTGGKDILGMSQAGIVALTGAMNRIEKLEVQEC